MTGLSLRCTGELGQSYQVWRAPQPDEPGSAFWTNTMPDLGFFDFTDAAAPPDTALHHLETRR